MSRKMDMGRAMLSPSVLMVLSSLAMTLQNKSMVPMKVLPTDRSAVNEAAEAVDVDGTADETVDRTSDSKEYRKGASYHDELGRGRRKCMVIDRMVRAKRTARDERKLMAGMGTAVRASVDTARWYCSPLFSSV